jgi:hypothetical protein
MVAHDPALAVVEPFTENVMSPTANVALELSLLLLERLRADGTMPQDEIDKTLSSLIHKHDIEGPQPEKQRIRRKLIAKMSAEKAEELAAGSG